MAYNILRNRKFIVEQNTDDVTEQPRYFDCFQCIFRLFSPAKLYEGEQRWKCQLLDIDNIKIAQDNGNIINPTLHKPLKSCPNHPTIVVEEPVLEEI